MIIDGHDSGASSQSDHGGHQQNQYSRSFPLPAPAELRKDDSEHRQANGKHNRALRTGRQPGGLCVTDGNGESNIPRSVCGWRHGCRAETACGSGGQTCTGKSNGVVETSHRSDGDRRGGGLPGPDGDGGGAQGQLEIASCRRCGSAAQKHGDGGISAVYGNIGMTVGVKIRHRKVKYTTGAEIQRRLKGAITFVDQHGQLHPAYQQVWKSVAIDVRDSRLPEVAVDAALLSKSAVAIAEEEIGRQNEVHLSVVVEIGHGNGTDRRVYIVAGTVAKGPIPVAQKNCNVAFLQGARTGDQIQDAVAIEVSRYDCFGPEVDRGGDGRTKGPVALT